MMLFTSLLFAFVFVTNANVPACNGPIAFTPTKNNQPDVWYPFNYENSVLPVFPDNFDCEYQINAPEGFYARFYLYVDFNNYQNVTTAPVKVIDQLQRTEELFESDNQTFYFIASGGRIKLSTGSSKVQFGFQLNWWPYPTLNPNKTQTDGSSFRPVVLGRIANEVIQVISDTQVSATVLSPYLDYYRQYFRSLFFFDGPTTNTSNLIGTGLQLSDGYTQYVSSGKMMTIMLLSDQVLGSFTQIILQDYQNTKDIVEFQGVQIGYKVNETFKLNATKGPVALQAYSFASAYSDPSNPNVITNLEGTGVLDVYLGGVNKNKSNLVLSYNVTNCQNDLPQYFGGTLKTYVLNSGVAVLNISSDGYDTMAPTKSFGRKGVIVSGNYGTLSTYQQNTHYFIDSPVGYNISVLSYSINYADLVPGVAFQITSNDSNGHLKVVSFNRGNLPHSKSINEISGKRFHVSYTSSNTRNRGLLMSFEVLESSAKSVVSISVASIIVFIMFN